MSYILKALKKADEERQRGQVPNLHSVSAPDSLPELPRRRWWPYVLLSAVLVVNAALGIWWWGPWRTDRTDEARKPVARSQAKTDVPKPAAKKQPPSPVKQPVRTAFKQNEPVQPKRLPAGPKQHAPQKASAVSKPRHTFGPPPNKPANNRATTAPAPPPSRSREPSTPVNPRALVAAVSPPVRSNGGTSNQAAEKKAAAKRLSEQLAMAAPPKPKHEGATEWRDLPVPVRASLPEMSFSMLVYSDNPSDRMISINGEVMHEGQQVLPGLTLDEITPDGAIFKYQNYRFHKGVF